MLDIEELIALSHDASTLLHEVRDRDEVIQIRECDGLRWVYTGGHSLLSGFRPHAPAEPVFPNHRCMLCALLLCEQPGTVLNLGFGLGSFERYFHEHLPEVAMVSVDTSALLVQLSRDWFQIPASWPVVIESAHEYLRTSRREFDLILCDIFVGGTHAKCLLEPDFYAAAARRLRAGGVLSLNLAYESDEELLTILLALRESFANVLLTAVNDHGNVIVLASQEAPPHETELSRRAQRRCKNLRLDLGAELARFTHLPQRG